MSNVGLEHTHSPIKIESGDTFAVLKRPWREAEQAPPFSAEVKNECSHAFTHPFIFMVCFLDKRRKKLPGENIYS
jgi:hypothetical protein